MLRGRPASARARGSEHAVEGNQFIGVVELPKGAIVKLKLKIDRKPTNMRSKVFLEAELTQRIDKYLYSSHRYGDFGGLVQVSDFARSTIEAIPTVDGRSDLKIHANSKSKPISSLLFPRKR